MYIKIVTDAQLYMRSSIITAAYAVLNNAPSLMSENDIDLATSKAVSHLKGIPKDDRDILVEGVEDVGEFVLTKASLKDRPITRRSLLGKQGEDLIAKYPDLSLLIKGIVSPLEDLDAVEDGEIFPNTIIGIEEQEHTLIHDINQVLKGVQSKFDMNAFVLSDKYFNHAYLSVAHLALATIILNERIKRIGTPEAHSFHVYQRLISKGLNPTSVVHLSNHTRRELYRSIHDIQSYIGQQWVFKEMLNILTRHTGYTATGYKPALTNDQYDTLEAGFKPIPIIDEYNSNNLTIEEFAGNRAPIVNLLSDLTGVKDGEIGLAKVILVDKITMDTGDTVMFNQFSMYMLLYLSTKNIYTGIISINVGDDTIEVSIETAAALMILGSGETNERLPCNLHLPIVYSNERLTPTYLDNIRKQLDDKGYDDHRELNLMLLEEVMLPQIHTAREFNKFIYDRMAALSILRAIVYTAPLVIQGILEDVLNHMYPSASVQFTARGAGIDELLGGRTMSIDDYNKIYTNVTSTDLTNQWGNNLSAIVDVANTLSTYSTTFVIGGTTLYGGFDIPVPNVMTINITPL